MIMPQKVQGVPTLPCASTRANGPTDLSRAITSRSTTGLPLTPMLVVELVSIGNTVVFEAVPDACRLPAAATEIWRLAVPPTMQSPASMTPFPRSASVWNPLPSGNVVANDVAPAPAGPVGPVAPVAPVGPVGPVAPVAPLTPLTLQSTGFS